jgi:hypothetical protein
MLLMLGEEENMVELNVVVYIYALHILSKRDHHEASREICW